MSSQVRVQPPARGVAASSQARAQPAPLTAEVPVVLAIAAVAGAGYLAYKGAALVAPVAYEGAKLAGKAAVKVAGAVDDAIDAGINAVVRKMEEVEKARLEREKNETAKQDIILSQIKKFIQNQDNIGQQATKANLSVLEQKSNQIRDLVLNDLAAHRREFQTTDFSDELAQARSEAERPDVIIEPKHTLDDLSVLLARLAVLDGPEARRLLSLVEGLDPETPGRIDALAIQLKVSIGRAAETLARELRYRDDLESMMLQLETEDATLAADFGRRVAEEVSIDKSAFDRLSGIYGMYQSLDSMQKSVPDFKVNDLDNLIDKYNNLTVDDFFSTFNLMFAKKNYTIFNENGSQIDSISNKCFLGLDLGPDYQAMVQTSPEGKLSIKLVRVVADVDELSNFSEYQRELDREASKKWCAYCKELEHDFKQLGIDLELEIHKDSDQDLLVLVNENLAREQQVISTNVEKYQLIAQEQELPK